jgi:8-oxo-dGTP pyrophosphatase MutT (NUDIX family)
MFRRQNNYYSSQHYQPPKRFRGYNRNNNNNDGRYIGAGIVPIMIHPTTGAIHLVLGSEQHIRSREPQWSDLGGSRDQGEYCSATTAAREAYEESGGLIDVHARQLRNKHFVRCYTTELTYARQGNNRTRDTYFVLVPWNQHLSQQYTAFYNIFKPLELKCKHHHRLRQTMIDKYGEHYPLLKQRFSLGNGKHMLVSALSYNPCTNLLAIRGSRYLQPKIMLTVHLADTFPQDYLVYLETMNSCLTHTIPKKFVSHPCCSQDRRTALPYVRSTFLEKQELKLWSIPDLLSALQDPSIFRPKTAHILHLFLTDLRSRGERQYSTAI